MRPFRDRLDSRFRGNLRIGRFFRSFARLFGCCERGLFDAVNTDDLEARLRRLGLDLVSYRLIRKEK
ncbi:MAG: hypothetical protein L0312_24335, partial [Acidobacteria bacterium]|nr:hypothetical protein [Acidobacteriota bacterium]